MVFKIKKEAREEKKKGIDGGIEIRYLRSERMGGGGVGR